MVTTRGQMKAAKRRRTEKDQPCDFNLEESASVFTPNPLSILVTIAHIFSFLKPEDLERCSQVNRCCRAVAQPMIPLHFEVEIHAPNSGIQVTRHNRRRPIIILAKRAQDNMKSGKQFPLSFAAATKILEEAFRTCNEKLFLNLKINFHIDHQHNNVEKFLKKFGSLVQHMDFVGSQSVDLQVFSHFLLKCPNLRTLDCSSLGLTETLDCIRDSPQNKLKKLKKFSVGTCEVESDTLGKLLKIASNLEEIEKLSVWLLTAVELAGLTVLKFSETRTALDPMSSMYFSVQVLQENGEN